MADITGSVSKGYAEVTATISTGSREVAGDVPGSLVLGVQGPPGKSAYAYAVEGGYGGTEEEFAAYLASGGLPSVAENDNGKVAMVVNGKWAAAAIGTVSDEEIAQLSAVLN